MEPIRKRKLYQDVLDRMTSAILNAEFPPGSKLPSEKELMLQLAVGRPAIREAMLALQQMGLIRISHGERARVMNPTPDLIMDQISGAMVTMLATNPRGLDELKEARVGLEIGLVRRATRNASRSDLDRLVAAHRTLQDERGDRSRFVMADMAFHGLIADVSGNQLVAALMRGVLDWLSRFRRELVSVRGAEKLTIDEHDRILQAVVSGDADKAALAMADHLERANSMYARLTSRTEEFEAP